MFHMVLKCASLSATWTWCNKLWQWRCW